MFRFLFNVSIPVYLIYPMLCFWPWVIVLRVMGLLMHFVSLILLGQAFCEKFHIPKFFLMKQSN